MSAQAEPGNVGASFQGKDRAPPKLAARSRRVIDGCNRRQVKEDIMGKDKGGKKTKKPKKDKAAKK